MAPAAAPFPGRSSPTIQRREQREPLASKPKEATARGKASGLLGGGLPLNLSEASLTQVARWMLTWPAGGGESGQQLQGQVA